ncbi:MAG: hypothetical protein SNJ57_12360 [Cyanobacteriota bacterium]
MAQTNLLELAKQGDPQAIATLMNRSLQPRGMTALVSRQGNCLYVLLQAEQVPNRQVLTAFVQNGISNLGVSSIQLVKISGQQFGMAEPAWTQDLQIDTPDLGDLGLGDLEAEPTAPPYDAGASLDGLDDIAPTPNPVGDILSELTAPPPSPTFEPEGWSPEEPALNFEDEFASDSLSPLEEDFSEDFSLDTSSGDLSDDLLADLDLGADLEADLMADFQPNDPGLGLGLSGLDDLESSLSDANLGSDFSEFDQDTGSFDSASDSASDSAFTDGSFSDTALDASAPPDAGIQEPSSDALLSELDALESTQDWSFDEPDEMLSDLGSLEGDLAQVGNEFLEIDAVTGESSPGMGLEPDEFDIGLPDLELSGSASDSSFDLTPEVLDFPLTNFDELSPSSVDEPLSEPSSGLEDLGFGDSSPSVPNDAGFDDMGLGDAGLDSAEFGNTEFGNTEFGSPDFDDASLSNADFDLDSSSADLLSESPASADLEGAFADLEGMGVPVADNGQQEDDFGAIAAGFETEAQFDDLLTDSSTAEFDQSTDFTEPAPPPPAPYVAEEISLDLDLDDIQLPPVTDESGDDWDADLEFGNLTGEDLSDFTADPAEPAETAAEAAAELEALDRSNELTGGEFTSGEWEAAASTGEPSGFAEALEREPVPVPFSTDFDFAESVPAAPVAALAGDAAPWLSELPPEFVIDVTLDGSLLNSAREGIAEVGLSGAIATESSELAEDLELEAQDLDFEATPHNLALESSVGVASDDLDFDLSNLDDLADLDALDQPNNSASPASPPDADLFDETSDIPLSQLPTEIPPSEIRADELDTSDFLDLPLSGVELDEAAFSSPYDTSPANEFTLEDETAPTELMPLTEETLPSELLVDDLGEAGGFEMDNLGPELNSLEREDFQPPEPEATGGDGLGLGGSEAFDLDAPAGDWQNELDPLPKTTFGLDGENETSILLDPSAHPSASSVPVSPSSELDREERGWQGGEVAASANLPISPLSSSEEGWNYGIPPAPPPPEDTFAYPASAPQTPDSTAVGLDDGEAEEGADSFGGRATNLLYAVLLALLAWILALIGRSLWTEFTQPEPPPAPAGEVLPQP